MYLILFFGLFLTQHVHSAVYQEILHKSAGLIADYNGPLPVDKLENVDQMSIFASNITIGDTKDVTFPQLKSLLIERTHLGNVPDGLLTAFPNLEELTLRENTIDNFKIEDLNSMESLESLEIKKEAFKILKDNSLNKLKKLKKLSLTYAEISEIGNNAFNGLEKLEVLNLGHNKLKQITKESLEPLKNLKLLNLEYNQIEKFGGSNIPTSMTHLEDINLEMNPIVTANVDLKGLKDRNISIKLAGIL